MSIKRGNWRIYMDYEALPIQRTKQNNLFCMCRYSCQFIAVATFRRYTNSCLTGFPYCGTVNLWGRGYSASFPVFYQIWHYQVCFENHQSTAYWVLQNNPPPAHEEESIATLSELTQKIVFKSHIVASKTLTQTHWKASPSEGLSTHNCRLLGYTNTSPERALPRERYCRKPS